MTTSTCSILDNQGCRVAEIEIQSVDHGWYYGRLVSDAIPDRLRRDLEWYDEVVSNQMLSYLDDALGAVEQHRLAVCLSDDACHRVYSLHLDESGEATFRITPVTPPHSNRVESAAGWSGLEDKVRNPRSA